MRCSSYIVTAILVTMNRIKEVLKEKGVKQIWLADKLGKVIIWSMVMSKTDSNYD